MQVWSKMDFGTGEIIFLDIRYIISIIQNFDWTHPVQQYETAERNQLPKLLTEAVRLVEKESQSAGAN